MAKKEATAPTTEPAGSKKPDEYQIESWCRTLMEAAEIQSDPEKMKLCQPMLKKKHTAIKSLADLKVRAKEVAAEEDEKDSED